MKLTVENWKSKPYQNAILNRAWNLSIGFILWNIWKERNRLIFKDDDRATNDIWNQTFQNIRETIIIEHWNDEDWKADQIKT